MMDNAKFLYRISDLIKQIDILNTEGSWESAWNETRKNQFRQIKQSNDGSREFENYTESQLLTLVYN